MFLSFVCLFSLSLLRRSFFPMYLYICKKTIHRRKTMYSLYIYRYIGEKDYMYLYICNKKTIHRCKTMYSLYIYRYIGKKDYMYLYICNKKTIHRCKTMYSLHIYRYIGKKNYMYLYICKEKTIHRFPLCANPNTLELTIEIKYCTIMYVS